MRRPRAHRPRAVRNQAGQAAVEAAIVMPLFVFLILGTLQLALAHQARLMTKYAAYRAVRSGSIYNGRVDKMEMAAMSVLLPMISHEGASKTLKPIDSSSRFSAKFLANQSNQMPEGSLKDVEVTICNPTTDMLSGAKGNEIDFDDPAKASGADWKESERTKLAVQVTFNYRMPIPFANAVISAIYRAKQIPYSLRMGRDDQSNDNQDRLAKAAAGTAYLNSLADAKTYVLPIRASYTMRMQSNLFIKAAPFPKKNQCVIPFNKL